MIKKCKKHGLVDHAPVKGSEDKWRCRPCNVDAVSARRKTIKAKLVQHFGGKCITCGYDKCIQALVFHHRDPKKKSFELGARGLTRAYSKCLEEAKKCDLLCANCHAEVHYC